MSTYYYFYLGYKKKGKFHGLGPYKLEDKEYNKYGLTSVLSRSSSYVLDIIDVFQNVVLEEIGEDLLKIAEHHSILSNKIDYQMGALSYLTLSNLAMNCGLVSGYVNRKSANVMELAKQEYGEVDDDFDIEVISPIVYNQMSDKEKAKYVFYPYINKNSQSYLANILVEICNEYMYEKDIDEENLYILLTHS